MKSYSLLFTCLFTAASLASAQTPLFFDTFQKYEPGLTTGSFGSWTGNVPNAGTGRIISINEDSSDWFHQGSQFQYLELSKRQPSTASLNVAVVDGFTPTPVITISMLYYEVQVEGAREPLNIFVGTGTPGGSTLAGSISLSQGAVQGQAAYTVGEAVRLDIVINNSATGYEYEDRTLGSQQIDVWVEGTLQVGSVAMSNTTAGPGNLSSFRFFLASDSGQTRVSENYIGEIAVFEGGVVGAAIPEPGTLTFISSLLALLFVVCLRRQ